MAKGAVFGGNGKTAEKVREARPVGGPFAGVASGGPESDIRNADSRIVIAAIGICCAADTLLSIGGAKGGRGFSVTAYDGKQHREYARDIGELHQLLYKVMDFYASPSEDWEDAYGIAGLRP